MALNDRDLNSDPLDTPHFDRTGTEGRKNRKPESQKIDKLTGRQNK